MYPNVARSRLFDTDLLMGCFSLWTCVGSIGQWNRPEMVQVFWGAHKICPVTDKWFTFPIKKSCVLLICSCFRMDLMPTSEAQAW